MNKNEILDADLSIEKGRFFFNAIEWWESKRSIYNFIVIGIAIGTMIFMWEGTKNFGFSSAIFWTLLYLISANVFFSSGWGIEVLASYYLKKEWQMERYRRILLIFGTLFSAFLTLILHTDTLYYYQWISF
ncbi:MAG: hypothetical protein AAF806_21895 [Bacteroidota bacterium]